MDKKLILQMTADIVASHASNNELSQADLLLEIEQVHNKLTGLIGHVEVGAAKAGEVAPTALEAMKPAVPYEAAFGAEKIFCMICGKGMKTLKRHLATAHDMRPRDYRKMFDIPASTPLVAKNYSQARKKMAKDLNLAEKLVKARAARKKKS